MILKLIRIACHMIQHILSTSLFDYERSHRIIRTIQTFNKVVVKNRKAFNLPISNKVQKKYKYISFNSCLEQKRNYRPLPTINKIICILRSIDWHNRCMFASPLLARCPSSYSRLPTWLSLSNPACRVWLKYYTIYITNRFNIILIIYFIQL